MRLLYNTVGNLPVFASEGGAIEKLVGEQMILLKDKVDVSLFGASDVPLPDIIVHQNPTRFKSMWDMWLRTFVVLRQLLQLETDIIISTHGLNVFSSFLYARLRRKRFVAWEIDHVMWVPPWGLSARVYHKVIQRANRVVVTTKTQRQRVIGRGIDPEKVSVIPSAIDTDHFSPISFEKRKRRIVCVAKFTPHKRQLDLIKAFRRFVEYDGLEDYELLLIGPFGGAYGSKGNYAYYEKCRDYVSRNNLEHKVTLTDYLAGEELKNAYQESSMFALLSTKEAFGLVVAEATACGLPCVVNNTQPLPEVVGDAGVVTDVDDVDRVAADLAKLAKDTQRMRQLGEAARERALQEFSAEAAAMASLKLYLDTFESH